MPEAKHRIEDLSVHFISLVDAPANQRPFLVKRAGMGERVFERHVVIVKRDAARRVVYGMVRRLCSLTVSKPQGSTSYRT